MRYFTFFAKLVWLTFGYTSIYAQGIATNSNTPANSPIYAGFNITDFLLNRSFFDGNNYELTSSYALLKGYSVIGWVHNFYPPADRFELYVAFEAEPVPSPSMDKHAILQIGTGIGNSADPLGVTLDQISGSATALTFSNDLTPAAVPVNLFDRKKHTINIVVVRVKNAKGKGDDGYTLSYIIDDKYKGKAKEVFYVYSNVGSSGTFTGPFIAPTIAYTNLSRKDESAPAPLAKILNWSFSPSQNQSIVANSAVLDEYASYIFINNKKQYIRMSGHDAKNFQSDKGEVDGLFTGHVAYKESVYKENECVAYFTFTFNDINNASHKIVEHGYEGDDKRSVSLSATINYFGNQVCMGSVINEGGNLNSITDSGTVQVHNVIGFNGMKGKQIDFANVILQLADNKYVVSGRFFSFDRMNRILLPD